jgi:alkylation response protein AidB-like acyl-CoA dehydrogenase
MDSYTTANEPTGLACGQFNNTPKDSPMSYVPPLEDYRLLLSTICPLDPLFALPGFQELDFPVVEAVLEEGSRFAREVLAPLNPVGDREPARITPDGVVLPSRFRDAYRAFVAGGWNAVSADPRYGGQGLPEVVAAALSEMWQGANLAFALCPLLTQGAIETLLLCGSEEQKNRYLPHLVTGEWSGTMNLTEPQAGSDLGRIESLATPDGAAFRLSGQKIFITYGEHDLTENIVHMVLARTPGAPAGTRGLTLFVVPRFEMPPAPPGTANEVRALSIEHKLGIHASPTCVMQYGGGQGARAEQIGELNRGIEHMFIMMNRARLAVGQQGVGIAECAYQAALDYARIRPQGKDLKTGQDPVPILAHPDVRRMLLTMAGLTEAARALSFWAFHALDWSRHAEDPARRLENERLMAFLTPITKGFATEIAQEVTSLSIQVHGGMGYIEETGVAQLYRDARILTIYEGTSGIQAMDLVGRKILRDRGQVFLALDQRIRESLARDRFSAWAGPRQLLLDRLDRLRECVERLLQVSATDPYYPGAVACPLLMMAGTVFGGWLLLETCAALSPDPAVSIDPRWQKHKQGVTRFYLSSILPRADAYAGAILAQEASPAVMEPSVF